MPVTATLEATAPKLMTMDEFWDFVNLPENDDKHFELVRGEVIELPSPTLPHGRVCMNAAFELEAYSRRTGSGYAVCNDTGVVLERDPDTVRGPDVAYFHGEERFADLDPKYSETIPALVVEVQSPSERQVKLMRKIANYLDSGVAVVWLINFEERFASLHRLGKSPAVFECGQALMIEELPGFSCKVEDLFRPPKEFSKPS